MPRAPMGRCRGGDTQRRGAAPRPRRQEVPPRRLPVFALAPGAFAIGTTEFVTMGLLPEMAATFRVSIPPAGWLVTAYALGVVVGAPLLTAAAHRYRRRHVLVALMALFTLGHVLTVLA